MKLLGNIIWLIFGGLHTAIEYFIAGLVLMITIIGIPFGLQSMKLGVLAIWPFGSKVKRKPSQPSCLSMFMNVLWFFVGGIWICLTHRRLVLTIVFYDSCSASPSLAFLGERCTFGWQSWPCHHSEWKSYNKYVLFNTFIMSQTIYC